MAGKTIQCIDCGTEIERKTSRKKCKECQKLKISEYEKHWYRSDLEKHREVRRIRGLQFRIENREKKLWQAAKQRAEIRGQEFTIEISDIVIPDLCPVFGVPMTRMTPYAASIDRIDSTKGYTKDNIQIISKRANTMKHDAGREDLEKFAHWILNNHEK